MAIAIFCILLIPLFSFTLIGLSFIFKKKKRRVKLILYRGGKSE